LSYWLFSMASRGITNLPKVVTTTRDTTQKREPWTKILDLHIHPA
jgi:hypothetical protein